jgi:glucose/mannose-6-phosphate isomerase
MHKVYDDWPQIARKTYESDLETIDFKDINHIVFSGMGGSGAIGDLFSSVLSKTPIHVTVVKGYLLPKTVDTNTLVIPISVSGNTAETIFTLKSAKDIGCKIIGFSSGGEIEKYCKKNQVEYRKIETIHSPRASFVKVTYSLLNILNSLLPINENDIISSLIELENTQKKISSNNLSDSNPAIDLANWVTKIPLIYYPFGLQSSAIRFKSSLQENAKLHVITEDVIEACHNGIVAWERTSSVQPILLRGYDDYIKTKERFEIIKEYFSENNIEFKEIESIPGNILTKLMTLIYTLDYTSIYKAVLSKIDPTPVYSIDFIKEKL